MAIQPNSPNHDADASTASDSSGDSSSSNQEVRMDIQEVLSAQAKAQATIADIRESIKSAEAAERRAYANASGDVSVSSRTLRHAQTQLNELSGELEAAEQTLDELEELEALIRKGDRMEQDLRARRRAERQQRRKKRRAELIAEIREQRAEPAKAMAEAGMHRSVIRKQATTAELEELSYNELQSLASEMGVYNNDARSAEELKSAVKEEGLPASSLMSGLKRFAKDTMHKMREVMSTPTGRVAAGIGAGVVATQMLFDGDASGAIEATTMATGIAGVGIKDYSGHTASSADDLKAGVLSHTQSTGESMDISYKEPVIEEVIERFHDGSYSHLDWLSVTGDDLVVEADGVKYFIPAELDTDIMVYDGDYRSISLQGQQSRITAVLELLDEPAKNRGEISRKLNSINTYELKPLDVEFWGFKKKSRKRRRGIQGKTSDANVLTKLSEHQDGEKEDEFRRSCALMNLDHKFIKVVGGSLDNAELSNEEIDAALESKESWTGDVSSFTQRLDDRDDTVEASIREKLLPTLTDEGYTFLGGNPDKGLLVAVKLERHEVPATAEMAQRLAKILLRGGTQLSGESFEATLREFPEDSGDMQGLGGYRDGIFGIFAKSLIEPVLEDNALPSDASSIQGHAVHMGRNASKGMKLIVDKEIADKHQAVPGAVELLGDSDAVLDLKLFRRIFGKGFSEGDTVTVSWSDLWVMEIDNSDSVRVRDDRMAMSYQAVSRAPALLQRYFAELIDAKMGELEAAITSGDKLDLINSELMPTFGDVKTRANAGYRPTLDRDGNVRNTYASNVTKSLATFARKGIRMRGAQARMFHSRKLTGLPTVGAKDFKSGEFDVPSPGIGVPMSWGLRRGDYVLMLAYPVLPDHDKRKQSTGLVMFKVEEIHKDSCVTMHPSVALASLRDEDGDQPLFHWPEHYVNEDGVRDGGFPAYAKKLSVSRASLSTKVEGTGKGDAFRMPLTGNPAEDSEFVLDVYLQLAAKVGVVDNTVSSAMEYMSTEELSMTDTPEGAVDSDTGEQDTRLRYMSKCIQASIEGMKHEVKAVYSYDKLMSWLGDVLPEVVFDDEGKLMRHPVIHTRKPRVFKGGVPTDTTVEKPTMEDVERELELWKELIAEHPEVYKPEGGAQIWFDMVERMIGMPEMLSERGFADLGYHAEAAEELFEFSIRELVTAQTRRDTLIGWAEQIRSEAMAILFRNGNVDEDSQKMDGFQYNAEEHGTSTEANEEGDGRDYDGAKLFLKRRGAEMDLTVAKGGMSPAAALMMDLNMVSMSEFVAISFARESSLRAVALQAEGQHTGWDAVKAAGLDKRNRLTADLSEAESKAFYDRVGLGRTGLHSVFVVGDASEMPRGLADVEPVRHEDYCRLQSRSSDANVKVYDAEPGVYSIMSIEESEDGDTATVVLKSESEAFPGFSPDTKQEGRVWRSVANDGASVAEQAAKATHLVVEPKRAYLTRGQGKAEVNLGDNTHLATGTYGVDSATASGRTGATVVLTKQC